MERIKTIISILFISFLPLSLTLGQEKKTEQKVKVVIADKSGTKVVIDTTFTGTGTVDSVILKGGNVIYIGKRDSESEGKAEKQVKVIRHNGDEKFDIKVSDDEFDNDLDRTKYVIAKNGITVSIEGNDEVKVKELANEIEKKLDINKKESGPIVKEVEKKIIKKN
jgi:acyl carrier protein